MTDLGAACEELAGKLLKNSFEQGNSMAQNNHMDWRALLLP